MKALSIFCSLSLLGCIDAGEAAIDDVDQPLEGSGLVATPATLDFGTVEVGSYSVLPMKLTNSSDVKIFCNGTQPSDPSLALSQTWIHELQPSESITIDVTFAPTTTAWMSGHITVFDGVSQTTNLVVPVWGSAK